MRATLRHMYSIIIVIVIALTALTTSAFGFCTRLAPGVQVTPMQSPGGPAGRLEKYQVQVTSQDTFDCASTTFFLKAVAPDLSWTAIFIETSHALSPGQSFTTTLQVTSPLGLGVGSYPVTVKAFNYANFQVETDLDVQYVVAPVPIPDFSISANPNSITVHQGLSGTSSISITPVLGFASAVTLSASGLPLGITASFNPPSISGNATSTATFAVAPSVATGNYTATITGTAGSLSHSTPVSITVDVAPQLTSITVQPVNPTIGLGSTIQFHAIGKYQDNSTQELTNNVTWSSSNTAVADVASGGLGTGKTAGTSTISAALNTISGNTVLTVSNSTGCAHTNPSLSITPTQTPQGHAGRLERFTVSLTNNDSLDCNNNSFLVFATAPLDPHTNAPEVGWTITFLATSFSLAPGQTGTTQMQVTSPANEPDGVYDITVNGVNWPIYTNAANTKVQYLVNATPSDFSLSAAPTALTVARGATGPVTITSSISGNFNSAVGLSVSGLPTGVTAAFDNPTIPVPGSGSAQLTFTVGASAPTGTSTVTVTGTGGSITRTTPVSLTVSATASTLTSITVTPVNISLNVGNTQQYRATGTYSDSSTSDITSQVAWTSSQPGFATIDATGKATAIATGSTSIVASMNTQNGTVTGSTGLTVNPIVVGCQTSSPGIDIDPQTSPSGAAGRLVKYLVTITDRDTTDCGLEGPHSFLLSLSAPAGWTAAFVTSEFHMMPGATATTELQVTSTANSPNGSYDIVITALNYHVFKTNTATATYVIGTTTAPDLAISVAPTSVSVQQGNSASVGVTSQVFGSFNNSVALSVSGVPSGVTATFTPSSIVAPGSGTSTLAFTAAANASTGPFNVTVTGVGGSLTRTANLALTVTSTSTATLTKIDVTPPNPSVMAGQTQAFKAMGTYSDNSIQEITNQVSWTSSNHDAATIDSTGLAHALAQGTTTIGAALGAINGSTTLTVTPTVTGCAHANPQVVVTPTQSPSGAAGRTESYSIAVTNMDTADCQPSKFLVSATPVAPSPANGWTINPTAPSLTLAPGATGTDTLQVTSPQNLDTGNWPLSVTVANWPIFTYVSTSTIQYLTAPDFALSASPSSVSVNQGTSKTITIGLLSSGGFNGTVALSASGFAAGGSGTFNPVSLSSGTSTLTLSATSNAAVGTYTVLVTGTSGSLTHSIPVSFEVKAVVPVLQSITVTPSNTSAMVGSNIQYHATGNYSNSSTQDLTTQVTWASSVTTVATIGAGGLANTVAAGTTTISATLGAISGSTALNVSTAPGGCTPANPSITITPAISPGGAAGRLVRYTVTVTNQDSAQCSGSQFILTTNNTPPPRASAQFCTRCK